MKHTLYILLLCCLTAGSLKAQSTYEFLRMDMSPRAAALGGSFVAANDDADIIFYNPAGINFHEQTPVSFNYVKHLLDFNFTSLAASRAFAGIGRIGAAVQYLNYGNFTRADEFGNQTGSYGAGDLALTGTYGNTLDKNFYYGASVKLIYSKIDNYSSSAMAFDLGLNYNLPEKNFAVGFAVLNMGTQLSSYSGISEKLPLDVIVGIAKKLEHLPFKYYIDFHRLAESESSLLKRFSHFTLGGEFTLSKVVRVRVGLDTEKRKELKIGNYAGLAGFNAGFGFIVDKYLVDYSFSSLGSIGSIHRFGIKTSFED